MKNNRFDVCWLQICPFERVNVGLLKPNREDYPYRLCVIDRDTNIVIDIKTYQKYEYIKTSLVYFMHEEAKKVEIGKRYAINELQSSIFPVENEVVKRSEFIIDFLKRGIEFTDGNTIGNEEYLERIKEENKTVKKKEKKGYYEYKRNYK